MLSSDTRARGRADAYNVIACTPRRDIEIDGATGDVSRDESLWLVGDEGRRTAVYDRGTAP